MATLRVLVVSDTHIGFDTPLRPRVERRRRGPDFVRSLERALAPALRGSVDLVLHAGDLFHRSRVPVGVAELGFAPLRRVAEAGVPVFVLPGNHERSRVPFPLLLAHERVRVFHGPGTFVIERRGTTLAVSGFPFVRGIGGAGFAERVEHTAWHEHGADLRLLLVHQAIEGSRVGPGDFMFRRGREVVPAAALPAGFDAVVCGHIHRHQALERDLDGRPLPAPVLFPGSTERTSFAEKDETKGTLLLELEPRAPVRWQFLPLPTRPMVDVRLTSGPGLADRLERHLGTLPRDAIVRLAVEGPGPLPTSRLLRRVAPPEMNVALSFGRARG